MAKLYITISFFVLSLALLTMAAFISFGLAPACATAGAYLFVVLFLQYIKELAVIRCSK